jgi:hypothetical protein
MSDKKDNAIHASIHTRDRNIGVDVKIDKKDNAIHASIHPEDTTGQEKKKKDNSGWIKKILKKKD